MTHPFKCPQCGYRNYVIAEDLDARRIEVGERAKRWKDRADEEIEFGREHRGGFFHLIRRALKL